MSWLVIDGCNFPFEVDIFLELNVREEEFVVRSFCVEYRRMALPLKPLGGRSSSTLPAMDFSP